MLGSRVFIMAFLFVLLVVKSSSADMPLQKEPAQPVGVSSRVRAACDLAYAIAAKIPGVSIRHRTGTFRDQTLREPVSGCGLVISGSFAQEKTPGDAAAHLHEGFSAQGWQEMPAYGADGKDGTSFAFRNVKVACLFRGEWNGGADGEPEIPAQEWYVVTMFCTSPVFAKNK